MNKLLLSLALRPHPPLLAGPFTLRFFSQGTPRKFYIPESYLVVNHSRSSGPGGQNVNKLNTKVELRFKIDEACWLPEDARLRLREQRP